MNGSRAAALATVAAAVLWGTTGTAAAFAPTLGPILIGAVARGGGGILQAVVNAGALRRERRALHDRLSVTALGALCVVIYPLAFYTSMHVGGVALGTVVSLASAPLASAVIERVADARPISRRWAASCALGVAGCALLCVSRSAGTGGNVVAGVLPGLAAGAAYAGYSWAMRRLMAHDISRDAAAGAVLGGGGVVLAAGAVAGGASLAAAPPSSWAVLAYLAVVPMFGGYVLFSRGLAGIDATTATTLTLLEPAWRRCWRSRCSARTSPRRGGPGWPCSWSRRWSWSARAAVPGRRGTTDRPVTTDHYAPQLRTTAACRIRSTTDRRAAPR
ncbi:DMT family transporter [Gordonia sp. PP30]|uniref:EamA family transporter n=1 Tax=Gordonia sp. PP30 TaxID=2935861 RepID=UPI0020000126|nr:EamA family transporter [Gordonia sp. PP30]UQE75479.1 DMT family transporter [Gordonia sp. PP30]